MYMIMITTHLSYPNTEQRQADKSLQTSSGLICWFLKINS